MKNLPPLPVLKPRVEGLRPIAVSLDALVKVLGEPLVVKRPRKLEKAR